METVDIIREVVESIDNTFIVKAITDNLDRTYTLTTDNTLHLQEGFPLNIGANGYDIVTIVKDVSITISGSVLPVLMSFDIYLPVYYHGTVIRVIAEMATDGSNVFEKTPFIYLREILKDKNNSKYNQSPIGKTTALQILILSGCKPEDWETTDHYEKAIRPMRNLTDRLIDAIYKDARISKFEYYETINHVNFGVYVDKGHTKSIFVDKLSGVELNIELPFKKQLPACSL